MPEWLKGADCKSAGFAYVGSNPTRPIFFYFFFIFSIGLPGTRTQNLSVISRVLYHWVSNPILNYTLTGFLVKSNILHNLWLNILYFLFLIEDIPYNIILISQIILNVKLDGGLSPYNFWNIRLYASIDIWY